MIKFDKLRVLNLFKNELMTYKKVKNRFFELSGDFSKIIDVHFISTGDNKRAFTIYFAVTVPKILEIVWKDDSYLKGGAETGVFYCTINDILTDFSTKPKVKYWDIPNENEMYEEVKGIIKNKLIPFADRFDSLESLNTLIDTINYPAKNAAKMPIMNMCLKLMLNKDREFYELAEQLKKRDIEFYGDNVDELVKLKEATAGNKMFAQWRGDV